MKNMLRKCLIEYELPSTENGTHPGVLDQNLLNYIKYEKLSFL